MKKKEIEIKMKSKVINLLEIREWRIWKILVSNEIMVTSRIVEISSIVSIIKIITMKIIVSEEKSNNKDNNKNRNWNRKKNNMINDDNIHTQIINNGTIK